MTDATDKQQKGVEKNANGKAWRRCVDDRRQVVENSRTVRWIRPTKRTGMGNRKIKYAFFPERSTLSPGGDGTETITVFERPRAARRGQFAIRQPAWQSWPVGRGPPGHSWSPSLTNGNCELSTCRGPWGSPLLHPGPGDQIKPRWLARAGDSSSSLIQNALAVWNLWHRAFSVLAQDSPHKLLRHGNGTMSRPRG